MIKEITEVDFVHLHLHNYYSIKDGGMSQERMIKRAKELGHSAIAETNHGKMYGSYEFYKNCTATEDKHKNPLKPIKPIVGVEAYVSPSEGYFNNKFNKKRYFHLILLAKNYEGYEELCRSTRISEKRTFRNRPVLLDSDIEKFFSNGNIIVLSACLGGEIQQFLLNGEYEKAKEKALYYKSIFKDDFYMELQYHGIEGQSDVVKNQVKIAKECGIECVITSDAHFAERKDKPNHDILICMQFGITLDQYDNKAYTEEHYMKSKEELLQDFTGLMPYNEILEALNNTSKVADKCNIVFPKTNHYPNYIDLKDGENVDDLLKKRAEEGLLKNVNGYNTFSKEKKEKYKERLNEELEVIKKTGYSAYFLNVSDILAYYNSIGGYSGLGRGSVVGSLVSNSVGITKVDPIEYGLFFDRFLNLERVSAPDADLDFDNRREEIFKYTVNKYGKENVCKIITFGKYGARAAIRAVGRVLDSPLFFVDKIAKAIKSVPNITIKKSLDPKNDDYSVEFDKLYREDSEAKYLIDTAMHFEGVIDHTGIHAAACIIGDSDVSNYIPLQWDEGSDMWVSQFYKDYNEELNLLKMDYLGLNNLTIIKETARLVNKKYGLNLTHEKIIELALKDERVIREIYAKGKTNQVFQFESEGMKKTLLDFEPKTVDDLLLLNAVYRPGPMQYIPTIIENKKHPSRIQYDIPSLKPILESTYGCPVYQEQIMMLFRVICGYSLGKADIIRRAMGHKNIHELENARKDFIQGYIKNGGTEKRANDFFEELMDFASYAFNKSHAAAYTITSLETAYLKLNHLQEYMTACLSYIPKAEDYPIVLEECKKNNLEILPPSINKSDILFSPEDNNKIRFGLSCIKGVGKSAKEILEHRPYNSYSDFLISCTEYDEINKGKIESLSYAGAFDELGVNRATAIQNIGIIQKNKKTKKKVNKNQIDFFSLGELSNSELVKIEEINEIPYNEKLEREHEVLFCYVSGHPLDQYRVFCKSISEKEILALTEDDDDTEFNIVGRIKDFSIIYRKKDNAPMGKIIIEDLTGEIESIAFTKEFSKYKDLLIQGAVLKFRVKAQISAEEKNDEVLLKKQFIIRDVTTLKALNKIFVKIKDRESIESISDKLKQNIGGTQIMFYIEKENKLIKTDFLIDVNEEIKQLFKKGNFIL